MRLSISSIPPKASDKTPMPFFALRKMAVFCSRCAPQRQMGELARLRLDAPAVRHGPIFSFELVLVVGPGMKNVINRFGSHGLRFPRVDTESLELDPRERTARSELAL